jgi:hypothetical protein
MKCRLYADRQQPVVEKNLPKRNDGIESVIAQPEGFQYEGCPLEVVDTASMSEDDRIDAYLSKAIWPAAKRNYKVRRVFGTKECPGIFFGEQVPALIVESDEGEVLDVYPHRMSGRFFTIRSALKPRSA